MKLIFFILILSSQLFSQKFTVTGKVTDQSGQPLSFANIRVAGTTNGTSANKNGDYDLRLSSGSHKLIASFIGYISDTIPVEVNKNLAGVDFNLAQTTISLPEITVTPDENPAVGIIRKAIERKKERNSKINSYEFEAYTKGLIRTDKEISAGNSSVGLSLGGFDSSEMKITGIIENKSKGYFSKPDNYKEIILARKQSSNFPSTINILTGGRFVQNFYNEEINFLGTNLPGPISDDALDYYDFIIEGNTAIDNFPVYQIYLEPENSSDPGFKGSIFIKDSTFDLIRVELQLNRAANTGGLFDSVFVFQQFSSYDKIYMPADYRLFAKANYLSLVRFGFDLNTILFDYIINPQIDERKFDKAVVTVLPDADDKDSIYWHNIQSIPNTDEEIAAYNRIDSISSIPVTFWDRFSFLASRLQLSKYLSVTGPAGLYHFNRVEGHALDFGFYLNDALNRRLNSSLDLSYGFADEKLKIDFNAGYRIGDYRTYKLSLNVFDRVNLLFAGGNYYNELSATLLALIGKYEYRNYYYSSGFDFEASGEVIPILNLRAGFENYTDRSAAVNTGFSFFNKEKIYPPNPPVYETKINALTFGFTFDFRNYIEDGLFRRRIAGNKFSIIFGGNFTLADNFIKSGLDFKKYEMFFYGRLNSTRSTYLSYRFYGMHTEGYLPYQRLYAMPGNIDLVAKNNTFRTLEVNEIAGDRAASLFLNYEWQDEFFRMLHIPVLKDADLIFTTFLNIAYAETGAKSSSILIAPVKSLPHPFYEAGFGISHALIPLKLEFAWKLNYRGENNFRVGINTFAF